MTNNNESPAQSFAEMMILAKQQAPELANVIVPQQQTSSPPAETIPPIPASSPPYSSMLPQLAIVSDNISADGQPAQSEVVASIPLNSGAMPSPAELNQLAEMANSNIGNAPPLADNQQRTTNNQPVDKIANLESQMNNISNILSQMLLQNSVANSNGTSNPQLQQLQMQQLQALQNMQGVATTPPADPPKIAVEFIIPGNDIFEVSSVSYECNDTFSKYLNENVQFNEILNSNNLKDADENQKLAAWLQLIVEHLFSDDIV